MFSSNLGLGCRHVSKALKSLMKEVQANEEVDEDELEEMARLQPTLSPTNLIISHSSSKQKNNRRKNTLKRQNRAKQPNPKYGSTSSFSSFMVAD
jgi:hypothetical protein